VSEDDLRDAMRQRFKVMSMREWCRLTGCNVSHVSKFMTGRGGPPSGLLRALNLEIQYTRKRNSKP